MTEGARFDDARAGGGWPRGNRVRDESVNDLGQPVGDAVPDWRAPPLPARAALSGRTCVVVPLEADTHAVALFEAFSADRDGAGWTYLPYGPFPDRNAFDAWLTEQAAQVDPRFFAVVDKASGLASGLAAYMRVQPAMGVLELGHIHLAPRLQRTVAATEALYRMIDHAFALGYRRCEWKCNALNAASRRAALRLGFQYEGTFRQAAVIKGRNRDTAWFSLLDREWPAIRPGYEAWLSPDNFTSDGRQRCRLSELIARHQSAC